MKISPLEAQLFSADGHIQKQTEGRTDMTKLNIRISQSCASA